MACYTPFVTVFLLDKKVDLITIGTILAANSLISILAQPGWGMVSDRVRSVKRIFMTCLATSAFLLLFLPFFHSTLVFALILALTTLFVSPLMPLMDNWVVQGIKNRPRGGYGTYRLWGSIGYAIMVIIMGKVLSILPVSATFFVFGAIAILTMFLCAGIPNPGGPSVGVAAPSGNDASSKSTFSFLLRSYPYVTFVVLSCLFNISTVSLSSYLPKLIQVIGGNNTFYGVAVALGAMSEVPVFFFSIRLIRRFKPLAVIITAFVFYIIRLGIYSLFASPAAVLVAQCLQGLSYGLFLTGSLYYMDLLAPKGTKATAVTLGSALYGGVSGIVGNYVGGRIIENHGIMLVYRIGVVTCTVVLVLFLLSLLYGRNARKRESELVSAESL